eukprot:CAMPEP_0198542218 /NCGR_PEP_ID=MMETSP1462-20131121/56731_1 /TAXON_ID=1333877 /ORGANISM="Brandtodinium nutriculum, Strain RCC3387" /LENGTH=104 /DNA_ID=CAMNT_0044272425 /DNA_START=262 /DNA_END=572 /DNA_ORIENTATION=-
MASSDDQVPQAGRSGCAHDAEVHLVQHQRVALFLEVRTLVALLHLRAQRLDVPPGLVELHPGPLGLAPALLELRPHLPELREQRRRNSALKCEVGLQRGERRGR